jgi:intein/homing endonuclease
LTQITQKGDLNYDTIRALANDILSTSVKLDNDSSLRTYKELSETYRETIQRRIAGEGKKSLGYKSLDKIVIRPASAGEMTTLFGMKGSGKCTKYSTLILTDNGFEKIGTYSKNTIGFSDLECNLITKDGNKTADKFFEEEVDFYYEVKTKFGYILECTATHPIYSFDSFLNYSFKPTEQLSVGDIVPILQNTNKFNKIPQKINYNDFKFRGEPKQECQIKRLKQIPQYLTADLSRLLGYYVANGVMFREISSHNEKIKDDIENILNKLEIDCRRDQKGIYFGTKEFINFMLYLHGYSLDVVSCTARFKEIPKFILEGTKENQVEFLKALFDCDSSINKDICLDYHTASHDLATQVQLLLLNMGIFSFISEKYLEEYKHTYYTVCVSSEDFDKYKELVNYKSLKYEFKENATKRNTNIKTIPYIKDYIDEKIDFLRKKLNVKSNGTFNTNSDKGRFTIGSYYSLLGPTKNITYEKLNKLHNFFKEKVEFHKYQEIKDILLKIDEIKNNNYIYDQIVSIKIIKERINVYDFHVPEVHNFY